MTRAPDTRTSAIDLNPELPTAEPSAPSTDTDANSNQTSPTVTDNVTKISMNSSPPLGTLIGGVVGGVVLVGTLIFAVVLCLVMVVKGQSKSNYTIDTPSPVNDPSTLVVYDSKISA